MKKLLNSFPKAAIIPLFICGGILCGIGLYTIYISKVFSYMSDDPASCVNCHIMSSHYQSWSKSSHHIHTTCNDCHVPHSSIFAHYGFKAIDGLYHSAVFTLKKEPDVIRPRESSSNVIMANCIRCHTQLNTEFVKTGMISYTQAKNGEGKACWDCHTQVPHTNISNLSSAPNAIAPMPESPVPEWLKIKLKNNK